MPPSLSPAAALPIGTLDLLLPLALFKPSHAPNTDEWKDMSHTSFILDALKTNEVAELDGKLVTAIVPLIKHHYLRISCRVMSVDGQNQEEEAGDGDIDIDILSDDEDEKNTTNARVAPSGGLLPMRFRIAIFPEEERLYVTFSSITGVILTAAQERLLAQNRAALGMVLKWLDTSLERYEGIRGFREGNIMTLFPQTCNNDLQAMYTSLASPPTVDKFKAPKGLRTPLYNYQKNSVTKMRRREDSPLLLLDPSFVLLTSLDGRKFFLNFITHEVYLQPLQYKQATGGILCEEMGTGKTCICISLVLMTKNQQSRPSYVTEKIFSSSVQSEPGTVTPLSRLAAAAMIKHGGFRRRDVNGVIYKEYLRGHYAYYMLQPPAPIHRDRRIDLTPPPLKVYLSRTTLIVVPATLVDQWIFEFNKHTKERALKILVLKENIADTQPLDIIKFDVVLMSQDAFKKERSSGGFEFLGIPRSCPCPYSGRTRTKDCRCDAVPQKYVSPLLQVRWLRMILDEGHCVGSHTTNLADFAGIINAQYKWVCTGTPTKNLVSQAHRVDREREDLKKLGHIMNFLRMEPLDRGDTWRISVVNPFLEGNPLAVQRVREVFEDVMVRNQLDVIEKEAKLPACHENVVALDFGPVELARYNLLVAELHTNAVLSQRCQQDYLFHSSNLKSLRQAVENISRVCFHFRPDPIFAFKDTLTNIEEGILKAGSRKYTQSDISLLHRCLHFVNIAKRYELDIGFKKFEDVCYFLEGLPSEMAGRWIRADKDVMAIDAVGVYDMKNRKKGEKEESSDDEEESPPELTTPPLTPSSSPPLHDGSQPEPIDSAMMNPEQQQEQQQFSLPPPKPFPPKKITRSMLKKISLLGSTSAKLNYLVNRVSEHVGKEKTLIFCQNSNEIVWLRHTFELLRIPSLMFASGVPAKQRSQSINTFNTSKLYWVFLMETKQAAFGIDLSSASRVYFTGPQWRNDVERQAIKRAHRIGQTREVFVETLVMRGSVEEEMVRRRRELGACDSGDFISDGKMRSSLQSCQFILPPASASDHPPDDYVVSRWTRKVPLVGKKKVVVYDPEETEDEMDVEEPNTMPVPSVIPEDEQSLSQRTKRKACYTASLDGLKIKIRRVEEEDVSPEVKRKMVRFEEDPPEEVQRKMVRFEEDAPQER